MENSMGDVLFCEKIFYHDLNFYLLSVNFKLDLEF